MKCSVHRLMLVTEAGLDFRASGLSLDLSLERALLHGGSQDGVERAELLHVKKISIFCTCRQDLSAVVAPTVGCPSACVKVGVG